jgi:hypothetical protein
MPLKTQKFIRRADLRANPETYYVFGDNLLGVGMGGQAREMRGEPNAVGIATKWSPAVYATDDMALDFISDWLDNFAFLMEKLEEGHLVVWPEDGIGTGLADMDSHAPVLWRLLEVLRQNLFGEYYEDTN